MVKQKKKIALITMHDIINYGSFFQTVATEDIFRSLGCEVEVIDYRPDRRRGINIYFSLLNSFGIKNIARTVLSGILSFPFLYTRKRNFKRCYDKYYDLTKLYKNYDELIADPPKADIYCVGSDQVWNIITNQGLDPAYFLEFANDSYKMSFSSSLGIEQLNEEQCKFLKKGLERFRYISVREKSSQLYLQQILKRNDIKYVLDPTECITAERWTELLELDEIDIPRHPYVLLYILGREKRVVNYGKMIGKELDCSLIKVGGDLIRFVPNCKDMSTCNPVTLMALFRSATFVITNSFHGTALAIEFGRQFITTSNKNNPRFESILSLYNLSERFVTDDFDLKKSMKKIDYNNVNSIINTMRINTFDFAKDAVNMDGFNNEA